MSVGKDLQQQLLSHLMEPSTDTRDLERAVLEDDDFFDQLEAAEAELIDSYVLGDLDASQSLTLAELIGRSPRLQQRAETALALRAHQQSRAAAQDPAGSPREEPGRERSPRGPGPSLINKAVAAFLLVLLGVALWGLHRDLAEQRATLESMFQRQRALEAQVEDLTRELRNLNEDQLRMERRWAEQLAAD